MECYIVRQVSHQSINRKSIFAKKKYYEGYFWKNSKTPPLAYQSGFNNQYMAINKGVYWVFAWQQQTDMKVLIMITLKNLYSKWLPNGEKMSTFKWIHRGGTELQAKHCCITVQLCIDKVYLVYFSETYEQN